MARPVFAGRSLLALVFSAPLIGIRLRWPTVLHAVTMEGLPTKTWPNGTATSACGLGGLRVLNNGIGAVPWPPYVVGLAEAGHTRCAECFAAVGKMRPRARFRGAA
jgi:hypothetical protein